MRETFPDQVLRAADQVVLVDVTPETLVERLRAGKVYPPERVETALSEFFRVQNLQALRETALRQVAESVEQRRADTPALGTREDMRTDADQAVGERVLALVDAPAVEPAAGQARVAVRATAGLGAGRAVGRPARPRPLRGRAGPADWRCAGWPRSSGPT